MTPRIVFVSSHASLGGAELYLERVITSVPPEWVARVVCLQAGPFVGRLRSRGLPVTVLPAGRRLGTLITAIQVRRAVSNSRANVVHANGVKAALVTCVSQLGTAVPVVWLKVDGSFDRTLVPILGVAAAHVVGMSQTTLVPLRRIARSPHVEAIPNAIERWSGSTEQCRRELRKRYCLASEDKVITVVGRLHPTKGQEEALVAFAGLLREGVADRLLFVGGEDPARPAYRASLRDLGARLGVSARVTFTGHVDDAVSVIAGSDVLVAPSVTDPVSGWKEGFGIAVAEALSSGCPVVAYDNGALTETVGDAAIVVPEGDRVALENACRRVLTETELRNVLVARGRVRVAARYAPTAIFGRWRILYETASRQSAARQPQSARLSAR